MTISRKVLIVVALMFAFGLVSKVIVSVFDLEATYGQPVQSAPAEPQASPQK